MILTSEQFRSAYSKLPFVLREYIADDELTTITEQVGKEHQLHVDTIGALYRETTNMLLGIINPTQFVGELKSVGVPEESIGTIVQELNEKVFMPLREKIKNQTPEPEDEEGDEIDEEDTVEDESSKISQTTPLPAQPVPQAFVPPNPAFVEEHETTPEPINTPPQPSARTQVSPAKEIPTHIEPAPQEVEPTFSEPHARTMQEDMIEMKAAQEHNPEKYSLPQEKPQTTPTPIISTPPPSPPQSNNREALHAVLKNYGIDPYREPPE